MKDSDLKLDLHTHCGEATSCLDPTLEVVKKIVAVVKDRGLDGIAVTEHYTKAFGYGVKEIVDQHLDGEIMVVPGREIDRAFQGSERGLFHVHIVELYLPGDVTFRFIAHPLRGQIGEIDPQIDDSIHGIELKNPNHDYEMDEAKIREVAEKHDLLLLANSDAHFLSDIGKHYNEIEMEELYARARSK